MFMEKDVLVNMRGLLWKGNPRTLVYFFFAADLIPEEKKSLARTYLGMASIRNRWDDFFLNGPRVSDDFMRERDQPPAQDREPL